MSKRILLVLILCAGLVWAGSAQAQVLQENVPGSVLVFPKWLIGDGYSTVLRIVNTSPDPVNVVIDLVCPGDPLEPASLCAERDIRIPLTGKDMVVIDVAAQFPPCEAGFAIAWAVGDIQQADEIKHNHLIGTAIISSICKKSQESMTAMAVQAITPNGDGDLAFDNVEFAAMPDEHFSDFVGARATGPGWASYLTLLSLDMVSGQDNIPVDVDIHVYDDQENYKRSIPLRFTCWIEIKLSGGPGLDPIFNAGNLGSLQGWIHIMRDSDQPVLGVMEEITRFTETANPLRHDHTAISTTFYP